MKKLFFSAVVLTVVSISSSFTSVDVKDKDVFKKNCTYRMYGQGQYLGNWTLFDVPDNVDCGSAHAKQVAIDSYNAMH